MPAAAPSLPLPPSPPRLRLSPIVSHRPAPLPSSPSQLERERARAELAVGAIDADEVDVEPFDADLDADHEFVCARYFLRLTLRDTQGKEYWNSNEVYIFRRELTLKKRDDNA